MDAQTLYIDLKMPKGWHELTDRQLLTLFRLVTAELPFEEIAVTCLIAWSGLKFVARTTDGYTILEKDKTLFKVSPVAIAELLPQIGWLSELPPVPVRVSRFGRAKALPADFQGVPFETFIICDNLYQGFLQTQSNDLLAELGTVLYPGAKKKSLLGDNIFLTALFYWMASLKNFFAQRFSDFLQPINSGSESGSLMAKPIASQVQDAMDAQIRALTKGDITKEKEVLALDTWRALTELNAQAREYKQLQAHTKS